MGTITLWHGPYLCPYIEEKTNNLFRNLHFNLLENKIEKKEIKKNKLYIRISRLISINKFFTS